VPTTKVVLFKDEDGTVPLRRWLKQQIPKARAKCRVRLERLAAFGRELRRPEADFLRDGIYELRVSLQGINYRILYFFHGEDAVVVSHGLTKRKQVPPKEIDLALARKKEFETNPAKYSASE
jgi:phage-related protein